MRYSTKMEGEVLVARVLDHMWGMIEDYQLKEDITKAIEFLRRF